MATNNAINKNFPLTVADGGTGAQAFTDTAPIVANGTSPLSAITAGVTGELLKGDSTNGVSFANYVNSDFTFTSSTANVNRTITVENTNNSNSNAGVGLQIYSQSRNAYSTFNIAGVQSYAQGFDNLVTFTINPGSSITSNIAFSVASGIVAYPLNPAFRAESASDQNNITGAGNIATLNATSVVFDINSDYNGTNTYTAPIDGKYHFYAAVPMGQIGSNGTNGNLSFLINGSTRYTMRQCNAFALVRGATNNFESELFIELTAGDTVIRQITIANMAGNTSDARSSPSNYFGGYLVC